MSTAIVLGATGLVGGHLTRELLLDPTWTEVRVLTRRAPAGFVSPKLRVILTDFEKLTQVAEAFTGKALFCCLGTTIKKAGSQKAFRRVDHDYPLEAARLAAKNRVPRLLVVSSIGADPHSRAFYLKVKGELEEALRPMPFKAIDIFRPSLLLGARDESRPLEEASKIVSRWASGFLQGPLKRYRAIPAATVARAMRLTARDTGLGFHVHEFDEIARIAGASPK